MSKKQDDEQRRRFVREVCMDAAPLVGQPKYILRIPWQQYVRSVPPATVLWLLDTIAVLTARLTEYGGMREEQVKWDAKYEDALAMIESLQRGWDSCSKIAVKLRQVVRGRPSYPWPKEILDIVTEIEREGLHRFDV